MGMSKLPFQILGELVEDLQHYRYFGLDYISMTIRCDDSGPRADAETSGA